MITKSCNDKTCVDPWLVIHPAGNVKILGGVLNPRFDDFYNRIAESVRFERCELGYILESEGPQKAAIFREDIVDEL